MLRLTHGLLRAETAQAAIDALQGQTDQAAVEGLVDLLDNPPSARAALAAISALEACPHPLADDALRDSLASMNSSVRLVAVQALQRRGSSHADEELAQVLRNDDAWLVRRAALGTLAERGDPVRWEILHGHDDPHWRVRHALVKTLAAWGQSPSTQAEIDDLLARLGTDRRTRGIRAYLAARWTGRASEVDLAEPADDPHAWCPFWDWDPAVLTRVLERLKETGQRARLDLMPRLLGHNDERVGSIALRSLRLWGGTQHLVEALTLLDEPRSEAIAAVRQLRDSLDLDRAEAAALQVLDLANAAPALLAWAIDQVGPAIPLEDVTARLNELFSQGRSQPVAVRCALVRLLARWSDDHGSDHLGDLLGTDREPAVMREALRSARERDGFAVDNTVLQRFLASDNGRLRAEAVRTALHQGADHRLLDGALTDPDCRVREALAEGAYWREQLQNDTHPRVRAAALTPELAANLVREPGRETSWRVLARAARMARVPFWKLEPQPPWQPPDPVPAVVVPLQLLRPEPPNARRLGPMQWAVAPLGVSGHYGLPVEGFGRAVQAGVNVLFWEPNYATLTEFANRLPPCDRNALHFIAGTFEADGKRVRRDAERALRALQIERLSLFLLFWVQSWQRITPDVREALEALQDSGKIAAYSLSTHNRPLAVEALEQGWNPVMVRHSAAHRGAEKAIIPRAVELGASLITFNNLCYARVLRPNGDAPTPPASDFYRYTLSQPGVRLCLSAPSTLEQLDENLTVLQNLDLPAEQRRRLLDHGEWVYREDSVFYKLVRSR
jgi:HEAT repeats